MMLALLAVAAQQLPPLTPGTASGEVEQSLRRRRAPPPLDVAPPAIVREARPAPPEGEAIRIERFAVRGRRSIPAEEILAVLPPPGEMRPRDLQEAADRVEALYVARGFPLAFAWPEVEGRTAVIVVAEGRIDQARVEGNAHYTRDFILDRLGEPEALERGLLLLDEQPSLDVTAILRPGRAPGSTELVLAAEDRWPLSLEVDYDNHGPEAAGQHRVGATVGFHNLWEAGHALGVRGVTQLDASDGDLGFFRIEYAAPLGSGTRARIHEARYDYEADEDRSILDPAGNGTVRGAAVEHALVRTAAFSLWAELGVEAKDLEQELLGVETAHDRLRLLVLELRTELAEGADGRWAASLRLRQGLGDVADGLGDDDPEASRPGADGSFLCAEGVLQRVQRIAGGLQVLGSVHGQYAREALAVSEQFALGGYGSVRGYPPFEFMGDRGWAGTLEARFQLPASGDPLEGDVGLLELVQLAAFVDGGGAILEEPLPGERRRRTLAGGGFGLRIGVPGAFVLRADVAWPLSDAAPSDGEEPRFYLSMVMTIR